MAQATISIRVDEDMKKRVEMLADAFGMNLTTLISIFLKTVEREQEIPFKISARDPFSLEQAISDSRERKNLFGPFKTGAEAVAAALED